MAILFEPLVHHDTNGIETLEEVALLFDRVDSPSLRLMLDMGHIAVTANRIGVEPVTYLRAHLERFGEKVDHIHVDDNHGTVDAHLAPGEGTVDLAGMTRALVESGYDGWFSAELSILGEYAMPDTAERLAARDLRVHEEAARSRRGGGGGSGPLGRVRSRVGRGIA